MQKSRQRRRFSGRGEVSPGGGAIVNRRNPGETRPRQRPKSLLGGLQQLPHRFLVRRPRPDSDGIVAVGIDLRGRAMDIAKVISCDESCKLRSAVPKGAAVG